MPAIILTNKGMDRQVFPLGKAILLIGRNPVSEVYLDSTEISRDHASIICEDGHYTVHDNGSTNGTFVNGKLVTNRILAHNDEIRFGPYCFQVDFTGVEPSPEPMNALPIGLDRNGREYRSSTNLLPVKGKESAGPVKILMAGKSPRARLPMPVPVPKRNPFPLFLLAVVGAVAIIAWYMQVEETEAMAIRHKQELAQLKTSTSAQIEALTAESAQARESLRTSKEDIEKVLSQISILKSRIASESSPSTREASSGDPDENAKAQKAEKESKSLESTPVLQYPAQVTFVKDTQVALKLGDNVAGSLKIRKGQTFPVVGAESDVVVIKFNGESVRVAKNLTNFQAVLDAENSATKSPAITPTR